MTELTGNDYSVQLWGRHAFVASILLIMAMIPAVLLLATGYTLFAVLFLFVLTVPVLVSSPRCSFYLFIAVNLVYAPYYKTGFAIHPWDIAAAVFVGAVLVSWLLKYTAYIDRTRFDYTLWALIIATAISAIFAYKPNLSIVPTLRILLIYIIYRAFYYLSGHFSVPRMIKFYIYVYTLFSLYNGISFLLARGSVRVFGFSGIAYESFCMVGVPVTLAFAIWSSRKGERSLYSIFFLLNLLGAVATMSRGPLLTIAIACPVLLIVSYIKAKRNGFISARRYVRHFALILIPVAIIIIVGSGLFLQVGQRFQELGAEQPTGTILLRFSLWKAAIEAFLINPLTGIGVGNFRVIDDLLPHLKFDQTRYYLIGMSFHNVFLQYLAETGLVGALALLALGWTAFSTGRRIFRYSVQGQDMSVIAAAFICSFIFFITIFYMRVWTWGQEGYLLALILAVLARQYKLIREKNVSDLQWHTK